MGRVIKGEAALELISKADFPPRVAAVSGARIIYRALYQAQLEAIRIRTEGEIKKKEIEELGTAQMAFAAKEAFENALLDANVLAAKEVLGAFLDHAQTIVAQTSDLQKLTKEIIQKICGPDLGELSLSIENVVLDEIRVLRGKRKATLTFPEVDRARLELDEAILFEKLAGYPEFEIAWDSYLGQGKFLVSLDAGNATLHQSPILPFLRERLKLDICVR